MDPGDAAHPPARRARRAVRRILRSGRDSIENAIDHFRWGDRTVVATPPAGLRLGNFLYLWLHAHARSRRGDSTVVLDSRGMSAWMERIPELRPYTVASEDVRFSDRREWDRAFLYQRFGIDFTHDDLAAFVHDVLAPYVDPLPREVLVVNVRRGDYYTAFRDKYAFDQVGYVREGLAHVPDATSVIVVSDDAIWCRENLDPILRPRFPDVAYAEPDPWENFRTIAGAAHLIGANSTFSYWGGYVASAIRPDARVVMPRFHARMEHGTDAHQLDPGWIAIQGHH